MIRTFVQRCVAVAIAFGAEMFSSPAVGLEESIRRFPVLHITEWK